VQPTGLALAALAGETDIRPKVIHSLDWLQQTLAQRTTTASLCYALMGLVGHGVWLQAANGWLESAYRRTLARHSSPYDVALLVLAANGKKQVGQTFLSALSASAHSISGQTGMSAPPAVESYASQK